MSFRRFLFLMCLGGPLLGLPRLVLAIAVESQLNQFKISFCAPRSLKCVQIQGSQARTGNLSRIYVFKNVELLILDRATGRTQQDFAAFGYLDFASEQIVLQEMANGRLLEKVLMTSTLESSKHWVN